MDDIDDSHSLSEIAQTWRLQTQGRPSREKKQVIQGLHMVSGTRCPAWSDLVKKWCESRAAAPKGQCPVGHRGEFPYVLRRHISGLKGTVHL